MATISAGDINLTVSTGYADSVSPVLGTALPTKTQTVTRSQNCFQHDTFDVFGNKQSRYTAQYNWASTAGYRDFEYIDQHGYTVGGEYARPFGYSEYAEMWKTATTGTPPSNSSNLIPEFDFAEFYSANLDSYSITFEYYNNTSSATTGDQIQLGKNSSTRATANITTTQTWTEITLDSTDGDFVDNYDGMLQVQFYRATNNSITTGETRIRNIRLTATFTGIAGVRSNRLPSGTVNDNDAASEITFSNYSGTLDTAAGRTPTKIVTTTALQDFFRSLVGGVFPNGGNIACRENFHGNLTPNVSVITLAGTGDTVDVSQNASDMPYGSDIARWYDGAWQGDDVSPAFFVDPYNLDYYPSISVNILDYPANSEDLANLQIKLAGHTDGAETTHNDFPGYQQHYNDVQFIYTVAELGSSDLFLDYGLTSTANPVRSDPALPDLDTAFTSLFRGGIRQDGSSDLDISATYQADNTGTGVVIDGGTVDFAMNFATDNTFVLFRKDRATPDLDVTATITPFKPRMILGDTVNFEWNITQSYDITAVGVIIANEKTTAFQYVLQSDPIVITIPDPYREFRMLTATRQYPVPAETRIRTVIPETRKYLTQGENRTRSVPQETRIRKETGYEQ